MCAPFAGIAGDGAKMALNGGAVDMRYSSSGLEKCKLHVEFPKNETRNMNPELARTKRHGYPRRAQKLFQRSSLAPFP